MSGIARWWRRRRTWAAIRRDAGYRSSAWGWFVVLAATVATISALSWAFEREAARVRAQECARLTEGRLR